MHFDIFTHLTTEEKFALYKLSRKIKLRNSIVVEIGSYLGASTCFLAAGLKSDTIYCIDTWQNDAMTEGIRDTYSEFRKNTERYRDKIIEIRGWSYDVVDRIRSLNKQINLLFIDGDHSYEGVKKDWDLYSPMLGKGSIVIFHDYGWAEGVQRVIHEDVISSVRKQKSLPNMWWGWMR
jgi:predicted O-methyltransferase YrrM